jgi:hypothetical protein
MLECKQGKDWADEVPGVTLSLPYAFSSDLVLIHDFADQGKATAASKQEESDERKGEWRGTLFQGPRTGEPSHSHLLVSGAHFGCMRNEALP